MTKKITLKPQFKPKPIKKEEAILELLKIRDKQLAVLDSQATLEIGVQASIGSTSLQ